MSLQARSAIGALLLSLSSALLISPFAARAADADAAQAFHALLADEWEWQKREFPEQATAIGDNRYNDRLTDMSAAAAMKRRQTQAEFLKRLNQIDPAKLAGQDSISYAVFATDRKSVV